MSKAGSTRGAQATRGWSSSLRFFLAMSPLCVSNLPKTHLLSPPNRRGSDSASSGGETIVYTLPGSAAPLPCLWPWVHPHRAGQSSC